MKLTVILLSLRERDTLLINKWKTKDQAFGLKVYYDR